MILTQQLITSVSQSLVKPAIRYLGKEILYKDFLASISRLSYLYQNELGYNLRMAFICRNSPAVLTTFFAMTNIRAVSIPINPELPPEEILNWLKTSKATHIAVTSDLLAHVKQILQSEHLNLPVIEIEKKNGGEYDTSFTPPADQVPKDDDPILMLRTSGTTGDYKYIEFNHKQILHAALGIKSQYHFLGTDRVHTSMNWYHPYAFIHGGLLPLLSGICCVIDHGLQAVEFLDFLVESRITRLVGVPSFFLKLLVICKNEKRMLPGIKSITVGLGSISGELKKAFELLNIPVAHCYGQVENVWTLAMQDTREPYRLKEIPPKGFMGKGLAGIKYKVMNQTGDEIQDKECRTGLLAVSGPSTMLKYVDLEKETKMAIRGTWLYTGDMAILEGDTENLTITYLGRKDDLLIVGDEVTALLPIDDIVKRIPGVQDGAALIVPNSRKQSVIVCAIVKKVGTTLNEKQILDLCHSKLPENLHPTLVVFTDLIPKDLGNNINYSKLRAQFSGITG